VSEVAVWTVGVLLGAAAMTGAGLVLARWWFGPDVFKPQYPDHRDDDEPEPTRGGYPSSSAPLDKMPKVPSGPANLFPHRPPEESTR
jgi:hypothetical protein